MGSVLLLACLAACEAQDVRPAALWDARGVTALPAAADPVRAGGGRALHATFGDRLRLVGVRAPTTTAGPGDVVEITLWWLVLRDCAGFSPTVFVHGRLPDADVHALQADHAPAVAARAVEWRPGDVLHDTVTLRIPDPVPGAALNVHVGVYEGDLRWTLRERAAGDGRDGVVVARLSLSGGADHAPPELDVPRRTSPIVVDGRLDEEAWQHAATTTPFVAWDGRAPITRPTQARLLWDDATLWLAFVATDPDPFSPYTHRDDPLYDSEALEIFVDADGDRDVYVELQAAPNDLHFDSSFHGGARQGMDVSWDCPFDTATRAGGDQLVQEWRIPTSCLLDVSPGEPRVGARWRVNLFRLERLRRGDRVIGNEASAWSSPLSGDFHKLARFGAIRFVEEAP